MGKQHNRRIFAGFYKRYDNKYIYVVAVVPDVVVHMDFTVLDGMETYNAGDREVDDAVAVEKCAELGLIPTAGSDRHGTHEFVKNPFGGIKFKRKMKNYADLISALKNREGEVWHMRDYIYF